MDVFSYHVIVDAYHEQQNPTSVAKLDRLIGYCDIADGAKILDVGCGKGWFLRRLARDVAIQGTGVDVHDASIEIARQLAQSESLRGELAFVASSARDYKVEAASVDVAVCLGASFAVGTFEDMLVYLKRVVKPGGLLLVGDIYARTTPMPAASAAYFSGGAERTFSDTADLLNGNDLSLIAMIDSSQDDWDHFENLHWYAADRWLRENPGHPEREDFIRTHTRARRDHYLYDRDALGWALSVARLL